MDHLLRLARYAFLDDIRDLNELHADLDVGPDSAVYGGTKAHFTLANVSCAHYPPREDANERTNRGYAAMRRLERQLTAG